MTRRFTLALVLLLAYATLADAQNTQIFTWDYPALPADVATYAQTVKVDGTLVQAAPTCALSAPNQTTCSVTIPTLAAGTHTLDVTAMRGGMSAETIMSGLNPANGPKNAANFRIGVTLIVTVQ